MSKPTAVVPPEPTESPFRTLSTAFAAALVASDSLRYLRAERNDVGCEFVFDDPHGQGDVLHRRFDAGMFPRVEPKLLFSARGFLMEEMSRLQGGRRHAPKG